MAVVAAVFVWLAPAPAVAGVTWPSDQLLPSFSPPAATQDLIYIRPSGRTFEAEGPRFAHASGRRDTDGWLCQVGIDAANRHMLYGPYEHDLPLGRNTARFRLKIDVNSGNSDHVATLDVRDNTTGAELASRRLARDDFTAAGSWVEFPLEFEVPALGHGIELRVYWTGRSYLKVDAVKVDRGPPDEMTLFASLKGVVNATRPRIFSYEGDAFAEGPHTWLDSLGLSWNEHTDNWAVLEAYKSEVSGLVVYDPAQPHTVNLATTLAGQRGALVAAPALLPRLTAPPFDFPILDDLRGRFASTAAVYDYLYNDVWPSLSHRVLLGLSPAHHRAGLREYAVAIGAAVIWLDPAVAAESAILDRFLSSMTAGAAYMGWWPEEAVGVERASRHGIATVASDYATNLTVHGGMPRDVRVKRIPPKPILDNKAYVAFILSDGDNLQYVEHLMRKLWNNPDRGKVPIGWTISPAMVDAMPGALDFYHATSTVNDNLISGPSGWGYGYPNMWVDRSSLERFASVTDDYALRAGLRVVTVWNTIVGGIDADVGATFAAHAPSLLGLTAQNTGGGLTIYGGTLPGFALSCNYCTGASAIHDHITNAARGWDRTSPRFILIQAQPWTNVTPSTFLGVQNGLGSDYEVVRPDHWFQLLRQANGLPIEPVRPVAEGVYFLRNRASGKCVAVGAVVDGLTTIAQAECADDDRQRFRVTRTSGGYVKLAPLSNGGGVIDVAGGPAAIGAGARTIVWDDLGGANQQWQPVWEADDEYHLIARHSDRCLDVPGGTGDDVQLQQWTCNGATAQVFVFSTDVPGAPGADADAGVPVADGGAPAIDAGVPTADGGTGGGGGAGAEAGGCAAGATTGAGALPLLGLAVLLLVGRWRRFAPAVVIALACVLGCGADRHLAADAAPARPDATPADAARSEADAGRAADGGPTGDGDPTAATAAAEMGKGFNLGQMFDNTQHPRTLDQARAKIDAYYDRGFRNVRIPITWTEEVGGDRLVVSPTVGDVDRNHPRLAVIAQVVDYALSRPGMYVVINAHHERALKTERRAAVLERLWQDISDIFSGRSHRLLYELLNEPHLEDAARSPMPADELRAMVGAAYRRVRAVDPARIVIIGGNQWFHYSEMARVWPDLDQVGGGNDPYVMATFHHYDPWTFNGDHQGDYADPWTVDDIAHPMDVMTAWATTVGQGMPVYIGEWGVGWGSRYSEMQCNNVRLWYQTFHHDVAGPRGMPTSVWDDGGWFKIFDHASGTFDNNLVDCIAGACSWTTSERFNSGCN